MSKAENRNMGNKRRQGNMTPEKNNNKNSLIIGDFLERRR
jgi:hypothetical protein